MAILSHYQTYSGSGRVINVTNAANGVEAYQYEDWGNDGFKNAFITLAISNVTVSIYATADNNTVANASATWVNVTNTLFGVSQITTSGEWHINSNEAFDRIRITYTPSNATNSLAVRMVKMR